MTDMIARPRVAAPAYIANDMPRRAPAFAQDSLVNLLSGLGVEGRDKFASAYYSYVQINPEQLLAAYRTDWIARKVVDIPAFDSTREWRSWQAEGDDIEKLEAVEANFFIQSKVQDAMKKARLFGGAALIMGTDDETMDLPLNLDKVRQGSLKFLHVVNQRDLSCGPIITDITSPWYGEPSWYTRNAAGVDGVAYKDLRIHPSRVIRIIGADLPDLSLVQSNQWGDSILQVVDVAVRAASTVIETIPHLMSEMKIDIINIPNLTTMLATQQGTDALIRRFQVANASKSTINALLLDGEEKWNRVETKLTGADALLQMYLLIASGAADIPATRLIGQSPAGLSSTGESDIRNYYDRLSADQKLKLTPALSRLDEVLIRSALGTRPPEIFYFWNSLWQMDAPAKAALAKTKAEVAKIDFDMGLIPADALREARINQLIEDGTYPGLETAIEEAEAAADLVEETDPALLSPDPDNDNEETERARAVGDTFSRLMADARPKPLYVRRDLLNKEEFFKWAKEQGFTSIVDDPHVTILYSRASVDWMKMGSASTWGGGDEDGNLTVPPGGPRVVEGFDHDGGEGAIVLHFSSSALQYRHSDMVYNGASHDYDEYHPHVTITKGGAPADLDAIVPYRGKLVFGPEIFEPIILNKRAPTAEARLVDASARGRLRAPRGVRSAGRFLGGGPRRLASLPSNDDPVPVPTPAPKTPRKRKTRK